MRNEIVVSLAAAVLALGVGCSGGNSRLSVSAKAVVPAAPASSGSLDLGAGIAVDRVRIALRRIGLEGAPAAAPDGGATGTGNMEDRSTADHGDGGEGGEVAVGPFLVDLSGDALASGKLTQAFDADVPPGTYRELRIVVGPVDAAEAGSGTGLAALDGDSVVLSGSIDGAAFTFTSKLSSVQKRESTLTVSADGKSSNVTLTVDPSGWFRTTDGSRLEPTEANRAAIEANIEASIDAFGDDDEDGHEDGSDRGEGSGDGSGHG